MRLARARVQQDQTERAHLAAPVMGMDTVSPGVQIPPGYSIYSYNLIGGEYGLRTRLGWLEYATGLAGEQVRSVLPFTGSAASGSNNRLFVCTESGIWDVSAGGSAAYGVLTSVVPGAGGSGTMPANTYYFVLTVTPDGASESGPGEELSAIVPANGSVTVTFDLPYTGGSDVYRLYIGTSSGTYTGYIAWAAQPPAPQIEVVTTVGAATAGPPTGPTRVVPFSSATADSGWGISTVFVNSAGDHYLCYCDEEHGYHTYAETGGVWTVGGIAGVPLTGAVPADLAFVVAWKNRLWFVEKDTAKAWYLGVGAVSGAATAFNFGARFQKGGELRGLWSWTHEGGVGMDDDLVAVSGGGDVVIYRGTDPSDASTFGLQGVWSCGAVPQGRRLCTDFGGELLLMTSTGIQSLAKLSTNGGVVSAQYETAKIANLFSRLQQASSTLRGWSMRIHPTDSALIVTVPVSSASPTQQLVMSLTTKGWHQYRDLPMGVCAEAWGGKLYFGTQDGRVCINEGNLDGVTLADPNSYSAINWSLLTGFTNMGRPTQKQIQLLRPTFLSRGTGVPYQIAARYRWDLTEASTPSGAVLLDGATWGAGVWGEALWGGAFTPQQTMSGAFGMGPEVAIAIRGTATTQIALTGIDAEWDEGGFL